MEIIAPLIAYSVALSIAAAIPGPGIAALVGQSLGGGVRASLFFILGIALGDILYLGVAVAGLAALAEYFSGAVLLIKVLGAIYLIYLGYKFWKSEAGLSQVAGNKNQKSHKAVLAGFAVTLGNPKTIVFYLALLPTVLDLKAVGLLDWLALSCLTLIILFATLTPYALLASGARHILSRSSILERVNRIAAVIIGGAGVIILGQAAVALTRRA